MPDAAPSLGLFPPMKKREVTTLQLNIGRLCNQACRHCHVESSPKADGPEDNGGAALVDDVLALLEGAPRIRTLDVTGGAPELNPHFRRLVARARAGGRTVYVRHNLTVQDEPGQEDLVDWFAQEEVALFCSLPCYLEDNVDAQRGRGVYDRSVSALRRLNDVGYGHGTGRELHLVYNPLGPTLPPPQQGLEEDYRRELRARFGIEFDRLVTITNQPIHRFRADLERQGRLDEYMAMLRENFNHATLPELMCRDALSVRWDGRLYDCDFNLVQDLPMTDARGETMTLRALLRDGGVDALAGRGIVVDQHCFACTAGCGSSCGGALVDEAVASPSK